MAKKVTASAAVVVAKDATATILAAFMVDLNKNADVLKSAKADITALTKRAANIALFNGSADACNALIAMLHASQFVRVPAVAKYFRAHAPVVLDKVEVTEGDKTKTKTMLVVDEVKRKAMLDAVQTDEGKATREEALDAEGGAFSQSPPPAPFTGFDEKKAVEALAKRLAKMETEKRDLEAKGDAASIAKAAKINVTKGASKKLLKSFGISGNADGATAH